LPYEKSKKIVPINYTSRDFDSIKESLVDHAKRYYSDRFRDFSEASFGSLMIDTAAYIGDVLSFYLDYQANESFLETSIEYNNVLKHARQMGYRFQGIATSYGTVTLYITVPAKTNGIGPDMSYAPMMKRGAIFSSDSGAPFSLNQDVDFSSPTNEIVVAAVDQTTGAPTSYAIRAYGQIISGELGIQTINIGSYQPFPRFRLNGSNITEVVSVFDNQGNQYYEVENLSQNTIYQPIVNKAIDKDNAPYLLKPLPAPRRFITISELNSTFIQFGYGTESDLEAEEIMDPSKISLDLHSRNYITDRSFDPTNLLKTDKLGVAPSNTSLTIVYRVNGPSSVNLSSNSLSSVVNPSMEFSNQQNLDFQKTKNVIASLEFINEKPIVGSVSLPTIEEIKYRTYGSISSQNRAVTKEDYLSLIYNMPPKFGAIKRASIEQDTNSFKRNLNIYTLSENSAGFLVKSSDALKNNLKTWLLSHKMINDTIDIMDGKVVNVGLEYEILSEEQFNKYDLLNRTTLALQSVIFSSNYAIGEPIRLGGFYAALKNIPGVMDVVNIRLVKRAGPKYSSVDFDMYNYSSSDGRVVYIPVDHVFEFKYPNQDIQGIVK
tara:strand:- start:25898 stop:27706 length:1809 start_codon:yes stop_codon:yes gene_type:complete